MCDLQFVRTVLADLGSRIGCLGNIHLRRCHMISSSSKIFSIIPTETLKFWSLAFLFWYLLTVNGAFGANTEWKNELNISALLWVVLAESSLFSTVFGIRGALFMYFKWRKISLVFLVPKTFSWWWNWCFVIPNLVFSRDWSAFYLRLPTDNFVKVFKI